MATGKPVGTRPGRPQESVKSPEGAALERNQLAPDRDPNFMYPGVPSTNGQTDANVLGTLPPASGDLSFKTNDPRTAPQGGDPGPM